MTKSVTKSPRVAEQCYINIHSLTNLIIWLSRPPKVIYAYYDQLQKAANGQPGLEKIFVMLSNVTHTIECIAPFTPDNDPDLAALYSRQAYFDGRRRQEIELPKKTSSKQKESEDGFISPISKQTVKRQQLEFRNFKIEVNNRFEKINENIEDIAGNSQNEINFAPSKTNEKENPNSANTLPPPVFLKLDKHYMKQLKTLTEIIPTLRSKKQEI
ncbi:hypothetical protein TNCV_1655801 [Trichonephila clavipes]|nr:hypothetical protein TNCV_1655801 [Trichonephila clavipes]